MNKSILRAINNWSPESESEYSDLQSRLLSYMSKECLGHQNAKPIKKIMSELGIIDIIKDREFQHNVIVPLKNQIGFFIGSCRKGIFLVSNGDDAIEAYDFYNNRIKSERRHLHNLKCLCEDHNLFSEYATNTGIKKRNKKNWIYFDESGSPSFNDSSPHFIVTAVIFQKAKSQRLLEDKLSFIKSSVLGWKDGGEIKSSKLNKKEISLVIKELSTVDFEVFSFLFDKSLLNREAFSEPKYFYCVAFSQLVNNVLDHIGVGELFFDEYSNKESNFIETFENFIRDHCKHYPPMKIQSISTLKSDESPFIQLADIICGIFKNAAQGKENHSHIIRDKIIDQTIYPYDKFKYEI